METKQLSPGEEALLKKIREEGEARFMEEKAMKVRNYRTLNRLAQKGGILFTGSSLMEQFPVTELCASAGIPGPVYNRGIGGTTTDDFLREISTVLLDPAPAKVFINIGTNDMTDRVWGSGWMDHLVSNYEKILTIAREKLPETEVYVMAFYPANLHLPGSDDPGRQAMLRFRTPENIRECSRRVGALAEKLSCHAINVNRGLNDFRGELKAEYTTDGVHMTAEAYTVIFENLLPFLRQER